MAIKEVKRYWESCQLDYVKEFLCHTEKDVEQLPACCVGSKAYVNETGNWYACGKDQVWKLEQEATEEGGGNTGGGGTGLPSGVGAYKQMATDGEGKWVPVDRLAWKEVDETELFSGDVQAGRPGRFQDLTTNTGDLVVFRITQGEKYLVVWDGTQHECKAFSFSAGEIQYNGFGNPALIPTNIGDITVIETENNLPFLFASYVVDNVECTVVNLDNSDVHTAQIYKVAENLKKISPEYLPEGIGYKEDKSVSITWDGNTEGLVSAVIHETSYFYKVSPLILSDEQIKAGAFSMSLGDEYAVGDAWDNMVEHGFVTDKVVFCYMCAFVREENAEVDSSVFPEPGVYFLKDADVACVSFISDATIIHKIPAEYIPGEETIEIVRDDNGGFTASIPFEEAFDLPANVLQRRVVFYDNENAKTNGNGKSVNIFKDHILSLGRHILIDVLNVYASSSSTYSAQRFVLCWNDYTIKAMESTQT